MALNTKDPHSELDYKFDWTAYLALEGDLIDTATVAIDNPTGLSDDLEILSTTNDNNTVTFIVDKGTLNTVYKITCTVTTTGSRTDQYTTLIRIQNK